MKARYRRGLARKGNFEFARAAVGKSLPCITPLYRDIFARSAETDTRGQTSKQS